MMIAQGISKTGTTAAQFLKLGIGSKALGIGGAFTSIADDPSCLYWNPGGLGNQKKYNIMFDHYNWFLDIKMDYLALILPLTNYGTMGFAFNYLHMGEMEVTTTKDPEGTGEKFNASSYIGQFSYGVKLTDRFSLGLSVKYIREIIWNSHANGVAIDIGTLFRSKIEGLNIGMSVSNYGNKLQMVGRDLLIQTDIDPTLESDPDNVGSSLVTDRFDLPIISRFGISYEANIISHISTTLSIDANHPNDNTQSISIGSEINYNNVAFFRTGFKDLFLKDSQQGISIGCGLNLKYQNIHYKIDYSYSNYTILGNPQKITITFVLDS